MPFHADPSINIEGAVLASELPTPSSLLKGRTAFASDGNKPGETHNNGTGALVYDDGQDWISVHSGQPVST